MNIDYLKSLTDEELIERHRRNQRDILLFKTFSAIALLAIITLIVLMAIKLT